MTVQQDDRPTKRLGEVAWRPPTIGTDRLIVRGWEPSDAEAVFQYASDPAVTAFMAWDAARTVDDAHTFLDAVVAPHYERGELDCAVALSTAPRVAIGGLGVYWCPREHQIMVLGYVLAQAYWGHGYMPEAARALIHHAFETTDVCRIFAPIFAENQKSRRAAGKMGLTFEGVLRSASVYRGVRRDEAIYAVLRGEHDPSVGSRTILGR